MASQALASEISLAHWAILTFGSYIRSNLPAWPSPYFIHSAEVTKPWRASTLLQVASLFAVESMAGGCFLAGFVISLSARVATLPLTCFATSCRSMSRSTSPLFDDPHAIKSFAVHSDHKDFGIPWARVAAHRWVVNFHGLVLELTDLFAKDGAPNLSCPLCRGASRCRYPSCFERGAKTLVLGKSSTPKTLGDAGHTAWHVLATVICQHVPLEADDELGGVEAHDNEEQAHAQALSWSLILCLWVWLYVPGCIKKSSANLRFPAAVLEIA